MRFVAYLAEPPVVPDPAPSSGLASAAVESYDLIPHLEIQVGDRGLDLRFRDNRFTILANL